MIGNLQQLYNYRSIIKMLVVKELKARYRGTFLGFLWSFLNPFISMMTYVLVFSIFLKVQMKNYSVFLLSGMLPWIWFASSITEASHSIISNGGLIKKIYLPTEIFPLVHVISNLINFLFSLPILLLLLLVLGVKMGSALLLFPILLIIQFIFTFGFALIVSPLTVKFRDFIYVIPNMITIWYFVTPIMYPPDVIPEKFGFLLKLNPFAYLATAYQAVFFYDRMPAVKPLIYLVVMASVIFLAGFYIFQRAKSSFPEEV